MPMNKNWHRWTYASISKHFENNRQGIDLFVEGDHRHTSELAEWAELRVDGPYHREPSKGIHYLDYEINILLTVIIQEEIAYRMQEMMGIFHEAMADKIDIYKYGTGVDDTQAYFECLRLKNDELREPVRTSDFGQIEATTRVRQGSVEGHYRVTLET